MANKPISLDDGIFKLAIRNKFSIASRTVRIERCVKSAALPDFGSRISAAAARTDTL